MGVKLTIVTVTYKDPEGLRLTLESLAPLHDTTLPWEVIVVDSSPDVNQHTLDVFRNCAELRHVTRPPKGIYEAMNAGWRAGLGELVWFLNGGDTLKNAFTLERAMQLLEQNPGLAWVQAGVELRKDGRTLYAKAPKAGLRPLLGINRICQQAVLYRASKIRELGGFKDGFRLAADYEFHLRALALGARDAVVPGTLVSYDMSGQSARFRESLGEFAQVQRGLRQEGLLPWAPVHRFVRALEYGKLLLLETLRRSRVGRAALQAWYSVRRLGSESRK